MTVILKWQKITSQRDIIYAATSLAKEKELLDLSEETDELFAEDFYVFDDESFKKALFGGIRAVVSQTISEIAPSSFKPSNLTEIWNSEYDCEDKMHEAITEIYSSLVTNLQRTWVDGIGEITTASSLKEAGYTFDGNIAVAPKDNKSPANQRSKPAKGPKAAN